MKMLAVIIMVLGGVILSPFGAQVAQAKPTTVKYVDPAKYAGVWYQIAHKPMWFEPKDCVCAQQRLTPGEGGVLTVYNSCNENNPAGKLREIRGFAKNLEPASNSKWEVDFGLPWKGSYWIIGLDPQYRWAVVSDEDERSVYILSKTPDLNEALYKEAFAQAASQLEMKEVTKTFQTGCTYPK